MNKKTEEIVAKVVSNIIIYCIVSVFVALAFIMVLVAVDTIKIHYL